jgi:hypothetical protein
LTQNYADLIAKIEKLFDSEKVFLEPELSLSELAKKLGGSVIDLNDDQYEDIALGNLMDNVKTNEIVDKETIMKKLKLK